MTKTNPLLSVIIVNYNVRDFISHALHSMQRALSGIQHEILVVDNASVDGSVQLLRSQFPFVHVIENKINIGFAAANNLAIKRSKGKFIVLINPDTVVQENTFKSLITFMQNNRDAGAATCKILNPDGSFSIDCRHSIPSPLTAFWKQIGLSRIFPKNRMFGRYNLTYLDPDQTYPVDAISGSFMFLRREVINDIGYLDEDFFMYCEDIDYCYRITQQGWKIYYVPESSIIHYKGESTKKNNLDYVINFNKSLYIFYKKHFQKKYTVLFRWIILFGVFSRGILIYTKNFIQANFALLLDVLLLNIVIFLTFLVRYEIISMFSLEDYANQYIAINILATVIFLGSAFFIELYRRFKFSLLQIFKTNFITFLIVSAITFFIKQLAFSRIVVLISALFSIGFMTLWRFILRLYWRSDSGTFSKNIFQKRALIVGTDKKSEILITKMKNHIQSGFSLLGLISVSPREVGKEVGGLTVVAALENMAEYARLEKVNQIIFSTHNIAYETIIRTMSRMDNTRIDFKMAPENMEVIIGKSTVEKLTDYPLVDIDYAIGKSFNIIVKRLFDLTLSSIPLLFTLPIWGYFYSIGRNKRKRKQIWGDRGEEISIFELSVESRLGLLNKILLLVYIFQGKLSFVGAPLKEIGHEQPTYFYKPGLTGIVQINQSKISQRNEQEMFELYYLKNQSFWLDIEILLKSALMFFNATR